MNRVDRVLDPFFFDDESQKLVFSGGSFSYSQRQIGNPNGFNVKRISNIMGNTSTRTLSLLYSDVLAQSSLGTIRLDT